MATDNEQLHEKIMSQVISLLSSYSQYTSSPEICRDIHEVVKRLTNADDPYAGIKQRDLDAALRLYPRLQQYVSEGDCMSRALKISAIGNVMDSAMNSGLSIEECIERELEKPFAKNDEQRFTQQLSSAKSMLVIGDNAGEAVFDRVLLEHLPDIKVTYAVRSMPVINDATLKEAKTAGIDRVADVLPTGCSAPGIILSECSEEFLREFYSADIVISKGQGNYETLSDCSRNIYFLLKAKCPVISGLLGVNLNDYVFMSSDE